MIYQRWTEFGKHEPQTPTKRPTQVVAINGGRVDMFRLL